MLRLDLQVLVVKPSHIMFLIKKRSPAQYLLTLVSEVVVQNPTSYILNVWTFSGQPLPKPDLRKK